jgi:hypothetical protein
MEEKKIIEFDFSSALDQLAALEKQAQETAKAMQGLDKATPEYQKLATELKVVRTEQNQLSQSVQASLKVDRQALDSLEAKKAQLKIMRQEYSKLSGAQRENIDVGVKLAANTKLLQTEIRELELGLGNTAANVGNYQEAVEKAFDNKVTGSIRDLKDSLGGAIGAFKGMGQASKDAGGGIAGIGNAAKVGLGGILIIVQVLIGLFQNLAENFEPFRVALAQTQAIGKAFFATFIEGLYAIGEAFKNPTKALEIFGNFADEASERIADAAKNAGLLEERTIAVEKAQRKVNVANAQLTAEVERQEKIADNQATSFDKRVEAIKKAQDDEKRRGDAIIALEEEKLSIIEGRLKIEPRSKELLDQQAEAQTKIVELQGQQANKLQDLQNKQAEITRSSKDLALSIVESNINAQIEGEKNFSKLLQKRLQLLEVQRQKELNAESLSLEQQIAINQNYANQKLALRRENNKQIVTEALEASILTLEGELANVQKGSDEEYKIKLRLIEAQRKADIEAVNQEVISNELRKAKLYKIEQDRLSSIAALNKEKADAAKKTQEDADKIALEKKNEEIKKEGEILASLGRAKKLQLELDSNNELLSIDERTQKKLELLELEKQKELEIANITGEERAAIERKYALESVKINDEAEVAKFAQVQHFTNQVSGLFEQAKAFELEQAGDNAEKRAEIEKKYATRLRAIRSFEVITGTASAIIKTLADPTLLFPANVIAASLIGAQGAIQLATINAAKFNKGGLVGGVGDGDTVPAWLTPGEVVINKRAAQDNLPLLNAINTSTGGAPITQRFANGGVVLPTGSAGFDMQELIQALQNNPPIVRVTDISRAQTNQVRVAQTKTL